MVGLSLGKVKSYLQAVIQGMQASKQKQAGCKQKDSKHARSKEAIYTKASSLLGDSDSGIYTY